MPHHASPDELVKIHIIYKTIQDPTVYDSPPKLRMSEALSFVKPFPKTPSFGSSCPHKKILVPTYMMSPQINWPHRLIFSIQNNHPTNSRPHGCVFIHRFYLGIKCPTDKRTEASTYAWYILMN